MVPVLNGLLLYLQSRNVMVISVQGAVDLNPIKGYKLTISWKLHEAVATQCTTCEAYALLAMLIDRRTGKLNTSYFRGQNESSKRHT